MQRSKKKRILHLELTILIKNKDKDKDKVNKWNSEIIDSDSFC